MDIIKYIKSVQNAMKKEVRKEKVFGNLCLPICLSFFFFSFFEEMETNLRKFYQKKVKERDIKKI